MLSASFIHNFILIPGFSEMKGEFVNDYLVTKGILIKIIQKKVALDVVDTLWIGDLLE